MPAGSLSRLQRPFGICTLILPAKSDMRSILRLLLIRLAPLRSLDAGGFP